MLIGVHIPAWHRHELLRIVLANLRRCNYILGLEDINLLVAVAGSVAEDPGIVSACDLADLYVDAPNSPLGAKANAAVRRLRRCELVVGIGSDDLVTPDLFRAWATYKADFMGTTDCYFYAPADRQLVHWAGYGLAPGSDPTREGETIGVGRCLSSRLLDALDWAPFVSTVDSSLDGSFMSRLSQRRLSSRTFSCADLGAAILDVKVGENLNPMPVGTPMPDSQTWLKQEFGAEVVEQLNALA